MNIDVEKLKARIEARKSAPAPEPKKERKPDKYDIKAAEWAKQAIGKQMGVRKESDRVRGTIVACTPLGWIGSQYAWRVTVRAPEGGEMTITSTKIARR